MTMWSLVGEFSGSTYFLCVCRSGRRPFV